MTRASEPSELPSGGSPVDRHTEPLSLLYTEEELRQAVLNYVTAVTSGVIGENAEELALVDLLSDIEPWGRGTSDPAAFVDWVRALWETRGIEVIGNMHDRTRARCAVKLANGAASAPALYEDANSDWRGQHRPANTTPGASYITETAGLQFLREFLGRWAVRDEALEALMAKLRSTSLLEKDDDWREALGNLRTRANETDGDGAV